MNSRSPCPRTRSLTLAISALVGSILVFGLLRLLGGDVALVILGQTPSPMPWPPCAGISASMIPGTFSAN